MLDSCIILYWSTPEVSFSSFLLMLMSTMLIQFDPVSAMHWSFGQNLGMSALPAIIHLKSHPAIGITAHVTPYEYWDLVPDGESFRVMRDHVSRAQFASSRVKPNFLDRGMVWLTTWWRYVDAWMHLLSQVKIHVPFKVGHEIFTLCPSLSSISNLSGKVLNNPSESRHCQKPTNPARINTLGMSMGYG